MKARIWKRNNASATYRGAIFYEYCLKSRFMNYCKTKILSYNISTSLSPLSVVTLALSHILSWSLLLSFVFQLPPVRVPIFALLCFWTPLLVGPVGGLIAIIYASFCHFSMFQSLLLMLVIVLIRLLAELSRYVFNLTCTYTAGLFTATRAKYIQPGGYIDGVRKDNIKSFILSFYQLYYIFFIVSKQVCSYFDGDFRKPMHVIPIPIPFLLNMRFFAFGQRLLLYYPIKFFRNFTFYDMSLRALGIRPEIAFLAIAVPMYLAGLLFMALRNSKFCVTEFYYNLKQEETQTERDKKYKAWLKEEEENRRKAEREDRLYKSPEYDKILYPVQYDYKHLVFSYIITQVLGLFTVFLLQVSGVHYYDFYDMIFISAFILLFFFLLSDIVVWLLQTFRISGGVVR